LTTCAAIKTDGLRCKARAARGSQWCWNHDPGNSQARKSNASKGGRRGGRGRGSSCGELTVIKERLAVLYEDLVGGKVEPKVAAVAAQIANAQVRLLETERKLKEAQVFEQRIAELEGRFSEADRTSSCAS
jgi:hypothetical protein